MVKRRGLAFGNAGIAAIFCCFWFQVRVRLAIYPRVITENSSASGRHGKVGSNLTAKKSNDAFINYNLKILDRL